MVMPKERLKYFATAFFHSPPQRGVPCGTGRISIGRAPFEPACKNPPPMKPRPEWSKLSPLNLHGSERNLRRGKAQATRDEASASLLRPTVAAIASAT